LSVKRFNVPWAGVGVAVLVAGCAGPQVVQRPLISPLPRVNLGLSPIQTIVVDAGHGGHDPGTSHYGLREKELTLDISRRLKKTLEEAGFSVVLTRDRDEFLPLSRRPAIANRLPADLFISVHANANRKRSVSGVEVYYPRQSVVNAAGRLPPQVREEEVALPTDTIRQVLWDAALSRTRMQSVNVASHICKTMRTRLGAPCRGVRGARFVVLRESWMPSVLVEVGYVSNRTEASRLASAAYRQAIAQGIAEGVVSYVQAL
jgi:N-acetylmuramoyl-L-alanine amidase